MMVRSNWRRCVLSLIVIFMMVIGLSSICAKAAETYGDYAYLSGHCSYVGSQNAQIATASARNITTTQRYLSVSIRDGGFNSIGAQSGVVGANQGINSGGYDVQRYSTVYGYCTIYNSSIPTSGTAENLQILLK